MGCKALTEHIETFTGAKLTWPLCIDEGLVAIGVPMLPRQITMDVTTGKLTRSENAYDAYYLQIHDALKALTPQERIELVARKDEFGITVPVFLLVAGPAILETQAEVFGMSLVTVDGYRMHERNAFRTRDAALAAVIKYLNSDIAYFEGDGLAHLHEEVSRAQAKLDTGLKRVADAKVSLEQFEQEVAARSALTDFEVLVYDDMPDADDLWGSLAIRARSVEEAEDQARAQLEVMVANKETELDLNTLRFRTREAAVVHE